MEIERREFTRQSASGEAVFSRAWLVQNPKAVVQLAHGMSEHSARYEEFAAALCARGYCVYANDHLGHGHSMNGHRGAFALQAGGFGFVQEDMHSLFALAGAEQGPLPQLLVGHSMGSILSGLYAEKWGAQLAGLAMLGTPAPNPFVGLGIFISNRVVGKKGYTAPSPLLNKLTGSTEGLSGDALLQKEMWLCRDEAAVRAFIADDWCGFDFTASGDGELFRGMKALAAKSWGEAIPDIPILIAAGGQDSAGKNGKGPARYAAQLRSQGHTKVTLQIFPDDRHELLHELDKREVTAFLLGWLDGAAAV